MKTEFLAVKKQRNSDSFVCCNASGNTKPKCYFAKALHTHLRQKIILQKYSSKSTYNLAE